MKKIILFYLLFVLASSFHAQSFETITKFDPGRNPDEDLKAAIEFAKLTNKTILLDIGGEWCIWCHRIDDFIKKTEEVKSLLDKYFVVVKVNYSKENKNEKFLSKYPTVDGYPHFFVLDSNGKLLHSQNTGELERDKDYDKEKFVSFLIKWIPDKKNN